MAELIDRTELMRRLQTFGRKIPKAQVLEVIARMPEATIINLQKRTDEWRGDRPKSKWHYSDGKPATIGQSFGVICDQCGTESEYCTNFCGECGADMRGEGE